MRRSKPTRRYDLTYSDGRHYHEYRPMTMEQCRAKIESCVKRYWSGSPCIDYQDWDDDDYIEVMLCYPVKDDNARQIATIQYHREDVHRVRSAAGRAGAQSRWANADREPTVQVRVFADDADWLKSQNGTIAQNVRRLRAQQETERP